MAVGWFTASSLAASFNRLWPLFLSWFLKYSCSGVMLGSWLLSLSPFPTLQLTTSAATCEGKHLSILNLDFVFECKYHIFNCLWNVSSYWGVSWIPQSQHISSWTHSLLHSLLPFSKFSNCMANDIQARTWWVIQNPYLSSTCINPISCQSVESASSIPFLSDFFPSDPILCLLCSPHGVLPGSLQNPLHAAPVLSQPPLHSLSRETFQNVNQSISASHLNSFNGSPCLPGMVLGWKSELIIHNSCCGQSLTP